MAGTTVFASKRALYALLRDLPGLSGAQVTYADPGGSARRERVWLGPDVEDAENEAVALRPASNRRQEEYLLHVMVEIIKPGTPETVEERMEALVNSILSTIDADPKLGGAVPGLLTAVGDSLTVETTETSDGIRVVSDLSVRVKAQPR